jgi:branched-chain amino acid transport system ATP-binding protein
MTSMLTISDIHTYIGESHILHGVSMDVPEGRVVALLGRNGVGKTTLIHSIIGFRPIRSGSLRFEGQEIGALPAHRIARLGIGLVPQGRRIFSSLTVNENLHVPYKSSGPKAARYDAERVFELFPALKGRREHRGNKLSGGEQQMLATGRALMSGPKLLLMDEPSEGLAPLLVREMAEIIKGLTKEGLTILLVEQKLSFVLEIADYAYVMSKGQIVYHSTPDALWKNEEVKTRHLGI